MPSPHAGLQPRISGETLSTRTMCGLPTAAGEPIGLPILEFRSQMSRTTTEVQVTGTRRSRGATHTACSPYWLGDA